MSKLARVGIAFVAVGILICGTWWVWCATRITHPISMPVSLVVGSVRTQEFKVNLNRPYVIGVQSKRRLPFDLQCCMMGIAGKMFRCNEEPLIQADWRLRSDGQIVAHGSINDAETGGFSDTLSRYLGGFEGQSGKRYTLDVNFTKDGTALAVTDPHLNVEVSATYYEDVMVRGAELSVLCIFMEAIGAILLALVAIRYRRNRHTTAEELDK